MSAESDSSKPGNDEKKAESPQNNPKTENKEYSNWVKNWVFYSECKPAKENSGKSENAKYERIKWWFDLSEYPMEANLVAFHNSCDDAEENQTK